ncbi:Mn-containing catalase [Neobacillus ginsengisoli]|uniref:Mn-containing catalase n=1 Tax=Neobacillus ginsengisoli TaxID=904295 RepID=A0ABT9XPL4_9BACI|nr:Mn-containing catalase [Neobacillus ginsengisoli]
MWVYEKKLQYPVRVSMCNPTLAKYLIEQYGGADGELAAALRYLNQRYTIPDKVIGLLTDIGTEEFAHLEMIATMVYKQTIYILQHMCKKKRRSVPSELKLSPSVLSHN